MEKLLNLLPGDGNKTYVMLGGLIVYLVGTIPALAFWPYDERIVAGFLGGAGITLRHGIAKNGGGK